MTLNVGLTKERERIIDTCIKQVEWASHEMEKTVIRYNPNEVWLRVLNVKDPYTSTAVYGILRSLSGFINWIAGVVPCGVSFSMVRVRPVRKQIEARKDYFSLKIAALRAVMTTIAVEKKEPVRRILLERFAPDQPLLTTSFGPAGEIVVDQTAKDDGTLLTLAVQHGFFTQAMKGDTVLLRRCQGSDCDRFFVPGRRSQHQIYHSTSCRSRNNMRKRRDEKKERLNNGAQKAKEKEETEATNGTAKERN